MLDQVFWMTLSVRMLAGGAVLVVAGLIFARLLKTGVAERALWQGALVAAGCLIAAELGGIDVRELLPRASFKGANAERSARVVIREPEAGKVQQSVRNEVQSEPNSVPPKPTIWPAGAWIGGTVLLLLIRSFQGAVCSVVRNRSKRINDGPLPGMLRGVTARLGANRKIALFESPYYESPVAFGLFSLSVGLPRNFEQAFTPAEQEVVMAHEIAHLAHRDPFWRAVSDIVCALCWWNPFAWVLRRKFLAACELAADEVSARNERRELLADVLVALAAKARSGLRASWSSMAGEYRSGLARRVTRLLEDPRGDAGKRAGWERLIAQGAALPLFAVLLVLLQMTGLRLYANTSELSPLRMLLQTWQQPSKEGAGEVKPAPMMAAEATSTVAQPVNVPEQSVQVASVEKPEPGEVAPEAPIQNEVATPDALQPAAAEKTPGAVRPVKIRIQTKWADLKDVPVEELLEIPERATDQATSVAARSIRMEPGVGWRTNALADVRISGPYQKVLAPSDYERLLHEFREREHIDLLSAPAVTTLSGREALISVVEAQTLVTGVATNLNAPKTERTTYRTEAMEFGQTLGVNATVLDNGNLRLGIEGTAREFAGYDDPGRKGRVQVWQDGKKVKGKLPLPVIRERQYRTQTEIRNGETVILFGLAVPQKRTFREKVPVLGDIPGLGRLFRSEGEQIYWSHLVLMVTAEMQEE